MRTCLHICIYICCFVAFGNAQTSPGNSRSQQLSALTTEIETGLRKIIEENTSKPNTEATWKLIRNDAENLLFTLYRKKRLVGNKPQEAYFIKMGLETMTAADIAANKKKLVAGFAAIKPGEFTIVNVETKGSGKY